MGGAYFDVLGLDLEYECLVMLYERVLLECKSSSLSMKRICYPIVWTIIFPNHL